MPFAVAFKNNLLDNYVLDNLSLHEANPGSAGASEISGGTPAYAKKAPTWSPAALGAKALSNTPVFDVPTGKNVVAVGLWKSGAYMGYVTVNTETYGAQGTYTITSGSIDLNNTASA